MVGVSMQLGGRKDKDIIRLEARIHSFPTFTTPHVCIFFAAYMPFIWSDVYLEEASVHDHGHFGSERELEAYCVSHAWTSLAWPRGTICPKELR